MTSISVSSSTSTPTQPVSFLNRLANGIQCHWLLLLNVFFGVYVITPFFAPVFMHLGALMPANLIYTIYSTQCHQLPERSYFLFGQQLTYGLAEITAVHPGTNALILRQFIGTPQMGWKVAWSDRMISLYTSMFFASLAYAALRGRMRALPVVIAVVLVLPMALDGGTHFISDLWGIGRGFRDSNDWLRMLTGAALPSGFYAGDGWGSFNSFMRLVTGVLAGYGITWLVLPRVDSWMPKS